MSEAQIDLPLARRAREVSKHEAEIAALVPLMLHVAHKAHPAPVTVESLKLAAQIDTGEGRQYSWLCHVPEAAGLVPRGYRRSALESAHRRLIREWGLP